MVSCAHTACAHSLPGATCLHSAQPLGEVAEWLKALAC